MMKVAKNAVEDQVAFEDITRVNHSKLALNECGFSIPLNFYKRDNLKVQDDFGFSGS